jgi:hypothetical protein
MDEYFKVFPTGVATLTVKLVFERELNVNRIIKCDNELITFAYYDLQKQTSLPEGSRGRSGESTGFPAITVAYSSICWVELNPGKPQGTQQEVGFQT